VNEEMSDPTSFNDAYFNPNPERRNSWRNAISKELKDMETCNVWSLVDRNDIPKDRKLISCKWVFKEKRDGVFRARPVALSYSQVPGIDFSGNYSPVVNDVSFMMILLLISKFGLKAWSLDIETSFLNGSLEEDIFMKLPQGFNKTYPNLGEKMALKLNKSIYGLVQAVQQCNKKFEEVFKLGFNVNNVDPCLLFKQEGTRFCVICLYVDDMIITGNEELMHEAVEGLKRAFKVKIQHDIKDFLRCEIIEFPGETHLYQKRIIKNIIKSNDINENSSYKTPSAPGFSIIRPQEDEKVDETTQK
jgi:Reverse transcriptase (RNA-dependent DNA polymerase)